jgi:hypothetical protein
VRDFQSAAQPSADGNHLVKLSSLRRLEKMSQLDNPTGYTLKVIPPGEDMALDTLQEGELRIVCGGPAAQRQVAVLLKDQQGQVTCYEEGSGLSSKLANQLKNEAFHGDHVHYYVNEAKLAKAIVKGIGLSDSSRSFVARCLQGPRPGAYRGMNLLSRTAHFLKDVVLSPVNVVALSTHSVLKSIRQSAQPDPVVSLSQDEFRQRSQQLTATLDGVAPVTSAFEGAALGGAVAAALGAVSMGTMAIPVMLGAAAGGGVVALGVNRLQQSRYQSLRDQMAPNNLDESVDQPASDEDDVEVEFTLDGGDVSSFGSANEELSLSIEEQT